MRVRLALLSLAALLPAAALSAGVDALQYDGGGPMPLLNLPGRKQGLETLLSRGRVKPEELMTVGRDARGQQVTFAGDRTIFRDEHTGAEVWRLTNFPSGVVRHAYSGVPAWNANGRLIQLNIDTRASWTWDQEKCTLANGAPNGQWSPTEPDMLYAMMPWEGARAVVAYDLAQHKAVRALGPVRTFAGVAPVHPDGRWVCWREGVQDTATTFGLAAADGSSYKSIATNGGIVAEQTPVTMKALPEPPALDVTRGGIHQMYFTKRPDHGVLLNCHGDEPHARLIRPDGKMAAGFENFTHQSWAPDGRYVLFMKAGLVRLDPDANKQETLLQVAGSIEGHTTWNSFDPDWCAMSWRGRFDGEIIRVSMRDDRSVARLCFSHPLNPDTTAYNNDEFACMSPDGTKVLFMSTMSGSVNEYLVVAANPRPPGLAGEWTAEGFRLTWTPGTLSHEVKGYRVCRTETSGEGYREIAGPVEGTAFLVKGLKRGDGAFFAVRAQEWSGLVSRYSNDVSADGKPAARYVEPETLHFTGFRQGFDPLGAGDLYYLFVPPAGRSPSAGEGPKDGGQCSVGFTNDVRDSQVWVRVAGTDVAFSANEAALAKRTWADWTWVNLGRLTGAITISSRSAGFKLDRVFITPDKAQTPVGRGLDYRPDAAFEAQAVGGVAAKTLNPFTAEVTWKPVPLARYYNVYASDRADFAPAPSNLLYSPPAGTQRAVDWGIKPGSTVFYKVVAVDYDGTATGPGAPAEVKTEAIGARTVDVEYESGRGGGVEGDVAASGGKYVLLDKGGTHDLTFSVPADGDYVFWHAWRADDGRAIRAAVRIDDAKYVIQETYDLAALGGRALRKDWVWTRYTFRWSRDLNGILHLKAGEHTLSIGADQPICLDRLIITNDQSLVPTGRLCTF